MLTPFEEGFIVGILVGEGHFGGDGKQPHITLRMHAHHEKLFLWLLDKFPASKLYGPYHHAGRHYYQWMARGYVLREKVFPLVIKHFHLLDDHIKMRITAMCEKYDLPLPSSSQDRNENI